MTDLAEVNFISKLKLGFISVFTYCYIMITNSIIKLQKNLLSLPLCFTFKINPFTGKYSNISITGFSVAFSIASL